MTPIALLLALVPLSEPTPRSEPSSAFVLVDLDADGLEDLFLCDPEGGDRLLSNDGRGGFVEATELAGLAGARSRAVLARDLDGDGAPELLLLAADGSARLWRGSGAGLFVDETASAGLAGARGRVARWRDHDGDGLADLWLEDEAGPSAWHALAPLAFEPVGIGRPEPAAPAFQGAVSIVAGSPEARGERPTPQADDPGAGSERVRPSRGTEQGPGRVSGPPIEQATSGAPVPGLPGLVAEAPPFCAPSLADAAGGSCMTASSLPTLGMLYPLSNSLFVDPSGQVGIGTTTPSVALEVVGKIVAGFNNSATGSNYATALGGSSNEANGSASVVCGGSLNRADGLRSSVLGGNLQRAEASWSSIGGGYNHQIMPVAVYGTIAGGFSNQVTGAVATVAGGGANLAGDTYASIGGGQGNTASGAYSVIPGGFSNVASGQGSFAAGTMAQSLHPGSFVWADGITAPFSSTAVDQFLVRASGGVGLGTNAPAEQLHVQGDVRVQSSSDVTTVLGSGALQVLDAGGTSGLHLDANEIQTIGTTLSLNADNLNDTLINGTLFVQTDRQVGIGNASPQARLMVSGAAGEDAFRVQVDGTTRLLVDDNGGLLLGANGTPSFDLQLASSGTFGGTAGKPGGGSWSVASDARLKEDVHALEGSLERLLALRGVRFRYRDPAAIHEIEGERIGMIAQQVQDVFPDWVHEAPDGYLRLTFRGFEALTVEALRELRAEKDAELAELAAQLAALRAELESVTAGGSGTVGAAAR